MKAFLRNLLFATIRRMFNVVITTAAAITEERKLQYELGVAVGKQMSRIKFAVLPLPFTEDQLNGHQYGEFITPYNFGFTFGECTIPAPGKHGYEQRAFYVDKEALNNGGTDLVCHNAVKFQDPSNSDALVPVIVTVLR